MIDSFSNRLATSCRVALLLMLVLSAPAAAAQAPAPNGCRALPPKAIVDLSFKATTLAEISKAVSKMTCTPITFAKESAVKIEIEPRKISVDKVIGLFTELAQKQGLRVTKLPDNGGYRVE